MSKKKNPSLALIGYTSLSLSAPLLPRLLNLCNSLGISYYDVRVLRAEDEREERAELLVPIFSSKKLLRSAKECKIPLTVEKSSGLLPSFLLFLSRPGLVSGLLVCILLVFLSSTVVWDIRIEGNERLHKEEILGLLSDTGLHVGAPISRLEPLKIENELCSRSEDISWISVNIVGTVANIQIIETEEKSPDLTAEHDCANLVASASGKIVDFENVRGEICTSVGDYVSMGQLLVSGIYGSEEEPFYYTYARGEVLAEVSRSISVEVERKYDKKVYNNRKKYRKSLIFFEKEIKFFSNCRNLSPLYDKIDTESYLYSFGGFKLPIGIRTEVFSEYETETALYNDRELLQIASIRLDGIIAQRLSSGELLSRSTSQELDDEGCRISCHIRTIENIAKVQPIEIVKTEENKTEE